ncbi:MAG: DNA polymerase III subunit gamma/tau [Patescibacteria group bacterium]|nr:DNA polymerase III subunit gamma/tau [Patescibacteria group bacterium]
MALYRKYRPQKFSDIVGQKHVKKTLTNAIKTGHVGHAYLFSGPRGTGKTTSARLLAKSLNCQNRKAGEAEPCGKCISCKEIILDKSMDVIEIDAASNRGIDEIRSLRDKIAFAPSAGRYKVYIIDEVHMLTREAFNALLKTLEEPPKHAIFIMATTELHKVPETILSRVQQFDFKRATVAEIVENLQNISKLEKISSDLQALEMMAKYADGSYRDAVSLLDQVVSAGEEKITTKNVQEILGIVEDKKVLDFFKLIKDHQTKEALDLINHVYAEGYDLVEFCKRLIEKTRQMLIIKSGAKIIKDEVLEKLSQDFSQEELLKMINLFLLASKETKSASITQLPLEMAAIELTNNEKLKTKNHNLELKTEEEKIESPKPKIQITNKVQNPKEEKKKESNSPALPAGRQKPIANSSDLSKDWPKVLEGLKKYNHSLALLLKDSQPLEIKNDKLILAVKFKFYAERVREPVKYKLLTKALEDVLGKKLAVECVVDDKVGKSAKKAAPAASNSKLLSEAMEVFG